jgi:hypothetical protein
MFFVMQVRDVVFASVMEQFATMALMAWTCASQTSAVKW